MTDTTVYLTAAGTPCRGQWHTSSNNAWRNGCRCPGSVAAHAEWLGTHRGSCVPRVDAHGNCVARNHGGRKSYQYAGCRCPEAIAAFENYRVGRNRTKSRESEAEGRRIKVLTGGRLEADPRKPWRGGRMSVDRNALFWLLRGQVDEPTRGERMAAAIRLSDNPPWVPGDAWWKKAHRMTPYDIGMHIGCVDATVRRLLRDRARLRDTRSQRRLADRRWKDAIAAAAADRARERAARLAVRAGAPQ